MTLKDIQRLIDEYKERDFDYEDDWPETILAALAEEIAEDETSDYQEAAKVALTAFDIRHEKYDAYIKARSERRKQDGG